MARHTPNTNLMALRRRRSGFTLAECLAASVVLALATVGVFGAILASQAQVDAQEDDTTAVDLGTQLMEKVAVLPLNASDATAGWPSVTTTSSYDSIGDYNGYADTVTVPIRRTSTLSASGSFTTSSPTVTLVTSGTPTLTRQKYLRRVSVSYPTSIFGTTVTSGQFAIVKVSITGGGGANIMLSRVISNLSVTR